MIVLVFENSFFSYLKFYCKWELIKSIKLIKLNMDYVEIIVYLNEEMNMIEKVVLESWCFVDFINEREF